MSFNGIKMLRVFARIMESFLKGKTGDRLENKLKNIQTRSIEKDPRTRLYPQLIVYNNREMRFHPPKTSTLDNIK